MPKLKKFKNQNDKKVSTKNLFVAFGIILLIMGGVIISKSYAIYKLEKKYDIIQSKIGSYSMGDVRVAVMVDGKEASQFPSYETNYKVEKVECTNGVNANFDVKNWQINIADMSATSTKCTVYFNSKETNSETPIAYSKEELIAINEEIKNMAYEQMKTQLLNDTYPIGSIYMSTTEDTVEKVQSKFGGTWVKYSEGTTLIGANDTYAVNSTGGSTNVTLSVANLPEHTHTLTPTGSVKSTFTGTQVSTSTNGNHTHGVDGGKQTLGWHGTTVTAGQVGLITNPTYYAHPGNLDYAGDHSHTVTAKGSVSSTFTGKLGTTSKTGSGTSFSVQNPYTAVYMYKRTA